MLMCHKQSDFVFFSKILWNMCFMYMFTNWTFYVLVVTNTIGKNIVLLIEVLEYALHLC